MDVVYRVLVRCWSGAGQVSFARERVNKFGCRVLINGRGVAKARRVVESRPHHQMRGSQGPRVGETGETGVIAGGEGQVGKATYLWMWLQSPRWLIPKVAQPQRGGAYLVLLAQPYIPVLVSSHFPRHVTPSHPPRRLVPSPLWYVVSLVVLLPPLLLWWWCGLGSRGPGRVRDRKSVV